MRRLRRSILAVLVLLVCEVFLNISAEAAGVVKWQRCAVEIGNGAGVVALSAGGEGSSATAYAVVDGVGLFRSGDRGSNWKKIDGDVAADVVTVTASPSNGQVIYAGRRTPGQGLWLSTDGGAAWTQAANAANGLASDDVSSVAFAPGNQQVILLGHLAGSAISVSSDGGKTWRSSNFGRKDGIASQVVLAVDDKRWLVATNGGDMQNQTRAMMLTNDGGQTWSAPTGEADYFGGPLPVIRVGDAFFSTKHHGTNKSENAGASWTYKMESHTRVIGSAGEVMFREGDRQFIRGTQDRILNVEICENLGQSWSGANFNLLEVVPQEFKPLITVPAQRDPFAHIRLAIAWAATPDGKDVLMSLGKAGLYHGKLLWGKSGPRVAGVEVSPLGIPEDQSPARVTVRSLASQRRSAVARVYADLSAFGLGEMPLLDDGAHDDGRSGDKRYANSFEIPKGTPAGPRTIGVVAEDQQGNASSAATTLEITSRADKLTVFDGDKFAGGHAWVSPPAPLNTFRAQTDEVHAGKVAIEMHGEGGGFIGGGWNWFGFYPANAGTDIRKFGNLVFWVKCETFEGDKTGGLDVSLVSNNEGVSGAVEIGAYCQNLADGSWHEAVIPLSDLYAGKKEQGAKEFDPSKVWMINLKSWAPHDRSFSVYLDDVGFDNRKVRSLLQWATMPEQRTPAAAPEEAPRIVVDIDTKAQGSAISPYIYGCAMGDMKASQEMGMTIVRAGGNPVTGLNWKLGFANSGADWYHVNTGTQTPPEQNWLVAFHGKAKAAGMESYVSMPIMGRVAKDGTSVAFDIRKYPDQTSWAGKEQPTDPHPNGGSGIQYIRGADGQIAKGPDGKPLTREIEPDPDDVSVVMSPQEQTDMLRFMIENMKYGPADKGGVRYVALDNEPALWSATHRGMYPRGISYDELWDRTRTYATLAKQIDPGIRIAGPTSWGWTEYFYSGKDQQDISRSGGKITWENPPDFNAHGKVPLAKWYLQKLAEHRKATGQQLVDILDFHFYPQTGHYMGGTANDPNFMESRVQETRVMWDPSWQDPTWMGKEADPPKVIRLIRLMKQWLKETGNENMQTSIGEYNFGGESDVSGGVAQAELLGVFAREGLDYAFYWFAPKPNSSTYFAFKMFRNPDGLHSAFGDRYLPAKVGSPDDVSVHASRDSKTGRLSFILVNKRYAKHAKLTLNLSAPVPAQDLVVYEYSGADAHVIGEFPPRKVSDNKLEVELAPMSVQRFDLVPR